MKTRTFFAFLTLLLSAAAPLKAATILFDLMGTAGVGLLPGNEPSLVTPSTASGGEIGAGISYDDATNLLTINVGWGSSQGFTDLTSNATASHIHGPTSSNNGAGFTQTSGATPFTLTRSNSTPIGGTFTNAPILLTAAQEIDLLNGKFYINLHTTANGAGEMRAFLVQVPEPSRATFALLGLTLLAFRRKR
jgi:CHRD domain